MDAVTIQVEDVDIKDILIKEKDVVHLTNVQVHGHHPITVAMKQRTIRVDITVMLTLGSSATVTLMDRIIGQGSLLDLMEQQTVVAVDSVAVMEMEAIGMTPTKMMQLLMLAQNNNNNNNAPSAASTVTTHTNASGWGAGNQSASNAAADNQ
eukprot:scaffold206375_cov26-Attheya_sp.AAC.1